MIYTEKQFFQSATTTGDVTQYTVPDQIRAILKGVDICNTSNTTATVRVHLVPDGGAAGTGNAIYYDTPMSANGVINWRGTQVMEAGSLISIRGSTTAIAITASGLERSL